MATNGPVDPQGPAPFEPGPLDPQHPGPFGALRDEIAFVIETLRRFGRRLMLAFLALLLPLWGFAELADEIHEHEIIAFDEPLLRGAHGLAGEGLDRFFVLISELGYRWGVVPFDIAFVLLLTLLRRRREATFAALALGGSALLNMGVKHLFARARPTLWESIAPELTYSFPSGHAMGSATLAWVLVLLSWQTRWRWPVFAIMAPFALLVGLSRVYLGVHYPSDILAGWAAASVWVATVFFVLYRHDRHPWKPQNA